VVGVFGEGWVVLSFKVCAAWGAEDGGGGEFPQFGSWGSVAVATCCLFWVVAVEGLAVLGGKGVSSLFAL
jgi:hypothetical protein